MLKECYYQDQTEYDEQDYIYLKRFIDRMIQHRYDTKGSYDGNKRIEEIKNLNLARTSSRTKLFLARSIREHGALELFDLNNLEELKGIRIEDYNKLNEREIHMKLTVDMFRNNLKLLDEAIANGIKKGELPDNYVLEIRCIGGFAMSYYDLRDTGMTEDMDSLSEINDIVKQYIRQIAVSRELPFDWVNDLMIQLGYKQERYQWIPTNFYFGKRSHIRVYVCTKEDLLRNKIAFAELYLNGQSMQDDRNLEIDYMDTRALLRSFDIVDGGIPAFADARLACLGIKTDDYPNLKRELYKDLPDEEDDRIVFSRIYRVETGTATIDEFYEAINELGYSKEDIMQYYGVYLHDFPVFMKLLSDL